MFLGLLHFFNQLSWFCISRIVFDLKLLLVLNWRFIHLCQIKCSNLSYKMNDFILDQSLWPSVWELQQVAEIEILEFTFRQHRLLSLRLRKLGHLELPLKIPKIYVASVLQGNVCNSHDLTVLASVAYMLYMCSYVASKDEWSLIDPCEEMGSLVAKILGFPRDKLISTPIYR